jgi:bifunctional enzyme CysN/CysC
VNVVLAGHVDHGKSTLLARLLVDTGAVAESKLAELEAVCKRRASKFELSFLLDAFQVERDQAVSIDATRVWFRSLRRRYAVADAPGHFEFLRHVVSGAADAGLALLVIDATAGAGEQTERHAAILALLGIGDVVLAVNKMDLALFSSERFESVCRQSEDLLTRHGLCAQAFVPTVATEGDNVVRRSARTPWYDGNTVIEALDRYEPPPALQPPLRFAVQDVYRRGSERLVAGTLAGGPLTEGDLLVFSPSGAGAGAAAIHRFPENRQPAVDGEAIALALDRDVFVEPGNVASRPDQAPYVTDGFEASVFWFGRDELPSGSRVALRLGMAEVNATVKTARAAGIAYGDVAEVAFELAAPIAVDVDRGSGLSRFAIVLDGCIAAAGVVRSIVSSRAAPRMHSANVESESALVVLASREKRFGHRGGIVWLTGLPSSGKSTIAKFLEQRLFALGWNAYVLDGDNLRAGLTGDLGFSAEDRRENVRRVAEVAALFADGGYVAIVALVSPHASDRAAARQLFPESFHEIHVTTSADVCERRDAKGLYRRARAGEIAEFTGVSAPYELPISPGLTLDSGNQSAAECVELLFDYVVSSFSI